MLRSLRDGISLPRDQTWAPAVKAVSPNHWTIRKFPVPGTCFFNLFLAALDLMLHEGFSLVVVQGLLIVVACPVAEHRL